jgi:hypothetical protein
MCTALVPDITEMRTTIYKIYENLWIKLAENVICPKTFGGGKKFPTSHYKYTRITWFTLRRTEGATTKGFSFLSLSRDRLKSGGGGGERNKRRNFLLVSSQKTARLHQELILLLTS